MIDNGSAEKRILIPHSCSVPARSLWQELECFVTKTISRFVRGICSRGILTALWETRGKDTAATRLSPCTTHFALIHTGTTIEKTGMTIENMGMTIENTGMTIDERMIQTPRVGVGSLDWLGIKPLGLV